MTVNNLIQKIFAFYRDHQSALGSDANGCLFEARWLVEGDLFNRGLLTSRNLSVASLQMDLTESVVESLMSLANDRISGRPLAQLIQFKEFHSLPFFINDCVLIPRPETEILVDLVLNFSNQKRLSQKPSNSILRIADLGAGSGCIGLTLASKIPDSFVSLVDVSDDILAVVKKNANILNVEMKMETILCDLGKFTPPQKSQDNGNHLQSAFSWATQTYDIVVSNPPYIPEDSQDVDPSVHRYEPHKALYGGKSGTQDIVEFFHVAMSILKPRGFIGFEIGWDQGDFAKDLFMGCDQLEQVQIIKDYSEHDRFVLGLKKG
jgi:release factor glutamine methyltransferase